MLLQRVLLLASMYSRTVVAFRTQFVCLCLVRALLLCALVVVGIVVACSFLLGVRHAFVMSADLSFRLRVVFLPLIS